MITPNMGLTAWTLPSDPYDHSQLASNFAAIDVHDHTQGKGRQVPRQGIANGAIDGSKIAGNAINPTVHIPDRSIPQAKLGFDSVGADEIIDGSIGPDELDGNADYSKIAGSIVPVGTVLMWFRPTPAISPPVNWEICDGRPWAQVPNIWNTVAGNMPDFRDRFPMGASVTGGTAIGATGGTNNRSLAHSHQVEAHTHAIAAHIHGIGVDGAHRHRWQTTVWDASGNPIGLTFTDPMQRGTAVPGAIGTRQSLYIPDLNRAEYYGENVGARMETTGLHSHGGMTSPASGQETTASAPNTTVSMNAEQDIRPAWIGVLFIMKVR